MSLDGWRKGKQALDRSLLYAFTTAFTKIHLLRGTIVNRTYGTHKNLHVHLFLLTIFGPIYYGPP